MSRVHMTAVVAGQGTRQKVLSTLLAKHNRNGIFPMGLFYVAAKTRQCLRRNRLFAAHAEGDGVHFRFAFHGTNSGTLQAGGCRGLHSSYIYIDVATAVPVRKRLEKSREKCVESARTGEMMRATGPMRARNNRAKR